MHPLLLNECKQKKNQIKIYRLQIWCIARRTLIYGSVPLMKLCGLDADLVRLSRRWFTRDDKFELDVNLATCLQVKLLATSTKLFQQGKKPPSWTKNVVDSLNKKGQLFPHSWPLINDQQPWNVSEQLVWNSQKANRTVWLNSRR